MQTPEAIPLSIAPRPPQPVIAFVMTFVTVGFALAVSASIFDGQSLVWPASGVALFWILRVPRDASSTRIKISVMAGVNVALLLAAYLTTPDQMRQAMVECVAMVVGLTVARACIDQHNGLGTLSTVNAVRHFLIALALSVIAVALTAFALGVVVTGELYQSVDEALRFGAKFFGGIGLVTPPLVYFSKHRLRPKTLVVAIAMGGAVAAATCALRVETPPLVFTGFLVLPLMVFVAVRGRTEAAMAVMATSIQALCALPLLLPDFHPSPMVALSFAWSVAAFNGGTILYLATSLDLADFERKRQSETWKQLGLAMAAADDRIWDWDTVNDTVWVESPARLDDTDGILMGVDNWFSEVHPEDIAEFERQREALASGESDRFECDHRVASQDLTWRWLSTRGSVIDRGPKGEVRRVIGTSRDISTQRVALLERQALEVRMAQSQRLESLGVLAGGVAHDFNNLLLAILTNLELTLKDDDKNEALVDARDAALRARELCVQLLAYAGQRPTALNAVPLEHLVVDIGTLLRASIADHISLNIELDGAPHVLADLGQLRQVIMNLVINAAEAIGDEMGEIIVRGGICEAEQNASDQIGTPMTGEVAYVEVVDNGAGMDAHVLDRLFDPFFTTKFQGRGLGMAAVLGIVRAHQGAVRVRSKRNRGTTVRIYLRPSHPPRSDSTSTDGNNPRTDPTHHRANHLLGPRVDSEAASASTGEQQAGLVAGRVIIADDEPAIRRTLSRALTRRGYEVILCEDGLAALEAVHANAERCDLLIMDVVMPRLTGRDALPRIRERAPALQVVLMSGYDADAGDAGDLDARCSYLQKPFTLEALDETLRNAEIQRACAANSAD